MSIHCKTFEFLTHNLYRVPSPFYNLSLVQRSLQYQAPVIHFLFMFIAEVMPIFYFDNTLKAHRSLLTAGTKGLNDWDFILLRK